VSGVNDRSLLGLNWLNFFVAQMQTGFGAFLSVYLTTHMWSPGEIGRVLGLSTIATMVFQLPAGALVDAVQSKRRAAGWAILAIAAAALAIGLWSDPAPVIVALLVQAGASCVLTPAIAAVTLSLAQRDVLGERLGGNVRYQAIGSASAAAIMGAAGFWFSHRIMFFVASGAGVLALAALMAIRAADLERGPTRTDHVAAVPRRAQPQTQPRRRNVALDRRLLIFAACMAMFSMANAAVLPIAANVVTRTGLHVADLVVAAAIVVPQVLAAILSPSLGRAAERWGRRPVLLLGFAAVPLRAFLFAANASPYLTVVYQALDGISAAVLGMIVPLVVADITRRSGHFNLAMGMMGLAAGLGAAVSNTAAGAIADHLGTVAAFSALGLAGLAALALVWFALPETARRVLRARLRPA
jgi:MFS family permease